MIKRIISHLPPRHLDDYIALCVLYSITGIEPEFIHPQEVTQEMITSKEIALVDVGMNYDPGLNNFDHHQSLDLPCSAVLVINHFYSAPGLSITKFLHTVDIMDRFGFKKCIELGLCVPDKLVDKKRKVILNFSLQKAYRYVIDVIKKDVDYNTAIELIYQELKTHFKKEVEKIEEDLRKEEEKFEEKLKNTRIFTIGDLKIGVNLDNLSSHSKVFDTLGLDILIEKNAFKSKHTSIVVNTVSEKVDKAHAFADNLMKNYEIVFVHKTRFIRVVNVDVKQVLQDLLKSSF